MLALITLDDLLYPDLRGLCFHCRPLPYFVFQKPLRLPREDQPSLDGSPGTLCGENGAVSLFPHI